MRAERSLKRTTDIIAMSVVFLFAVHHTYMNTYDSHVYKSGYCEFGDGHRAYVECFGNKHARPMLFLHGVPGSGFSDSHKKLFDPERDNVIFYDQRRAGKSISFCTISENTTDNLVEDIPRILAYADVDSAYVIGTSWGVALALFLPCGILNE